MAEDNEAASGACHEEHLDVDIDDDDEGELFVRKIPVTDREENNTVMYLIRLPERGGRRRTLWVFSRQLEHLLFGTEQHGGNLHHTMEELNLTTAVRHYEKSTLEEHNITVGEFSTLMGVFNEWKRTLDPLANKSARKCALVPQKVACTVALARGSKEVLQALGGQVPEGWIVREKRAKDAAKGEYDLSLEEPEEGEDLDELFAQSLDAEVALSFDAKAFSEELMVGEGSLGQHYALKKVPKTLARQIEQLRRFRTSVLNASRSGMRVEKVTVESDAATMLRLCGYAQVQCVVPPYPMSFEIFRHPQAVDLVDQFCR